MLQNWFVKTTIRDCQKCRKTFNDKKFYVHIVSKNNFSIPKIHFSFHFIVLFEPEMTLTFNILNFHLQW